MTSDKWAVEDESGNRLALFEMKGSKVKTEWATQTGKKEPLDLKRKQAEAMASLLHAISPASLSSVKAVPRS